MGENNSEPWDLFPELLNCFLFLSFLFFSSHVCCEISGQDEVRTSNLLHQSWDFLHSGLMLQQLSHLAD